MFEGGFVDAKKAARADAEQEGGNDRGQEAGGAGGAEPVEAEGGGVGGRGFGDRGYAGDEFVQAGDDDGIEVGGILQSRAGGLVFTWAAVRRLCVKRSMPRLKGTYPQSKHEGHEEGCRAATRRGPGRVCDCERCAWRGDLLPGGRSSWVSRIFKTRAMQAMQVRELRMSVSSGPMKLET